MDLHITPSELLIGMLAVLAAVALIAEKIKIAYPILLVFAGSFMGILPALLHGKMPEVKVSPDLVFFIFLPPLLYYAGLLTTWRDFKANIRPISELAVGLVVFTMVVVAVAVRWANPDMPWPVAFLLGAIVSPPDAVAATAVLSKLKVPRRIVTILEGESLVNDATALTAYRIALGVIGGGAFTYAGALWQVTIVAVGGVLVGLAVSYLAAKLMEKVEAPHIATVLSLLVPYAAYLPAEKVHVSGVLAAVAAGIVMGRRLPSLGSAQYRIRAMSLWQSLIFLFEGTVFVLIGIQLFDIVQRVEPKELFRATVYISLASILSRIVWVYAATYLPRLVNLGSTKNPPDPRRVFVISWAGMRGIVTLASALAIPTEIPHTRTPFPYRDEILFLSFAVIFATLVFQGLTLTPIIRFLGISEDGREEHKEETQARLDAAHAALSRLTVLSFDESINPDMINRVKAEYEDRIARLGGDPHETLGAAHTSDLQVLNTLRREALVAERKMITFMRDQNILGDEILRRILVEIDLEEAQLS